MMNENAILRISHAVDDNLSMAGSNDADGPRDIAATLRRQRAADAALRAGWTAAMVPAPASLTDRITAAIAVTAVDTTGRGAAHAWRAWVGALAAAVALAGGVTLLAVRMHTVTATGGGPAIVAESGSSPLAAALVNLDARPDPVLRRFEDPLVTEAARLREDTRRAAERVLAQLPVRVEWR